MVEIIFSESGRIRKVIMPRTIRQVHVVDTDSGVHIAVVVCGHAQGELIPPLYVVKSGMSSSIEELVSSTARASEGCTGSHRNRMGRWKTV